MSQLEAGVHGQNDESGLGLCRFIQSSITVVKEAKKVYHPR